jgi:hypothetical protein
MERDSRGQEKGGGIDGPFIAFFFVLEGEKRWM